MSGFKVGRPITGSSSSGTPVVSVRRPDLIIHSIQFATSETKNDHFHYLFQTSNSHPSIDYDLDDWSRGTRIVIPEWLGIYYKNLGGSIPKRSLRACFTRNQAVSLILTVRSNVYGLKGKITATPTLDGSRSQLKPVTADFYFGAWVKEDKILITFDGTLPNEIGRYVLKINWEIQGTGFRFTGPQETEHKIYAIYDQPLWPEYDSPKVKDPGSKTTRAAGTHSGTEKRLDLMMRLIGGRRRRHRVANKKDLVDIYWRLHKGINNTPGAPPYFNGKNSVHITSEAFSKGTDLHLDLQWVAWALSETETRISGGKTKRSHWNDASCIGHVQLAKTMLAAVGLFARRTWVFPTTSTMPDGTTRTFADTDLFCLGELDGAKRQTWIFEHDGKRFPANPGLMEPYNAWENFEACMLSPTGKFLTGGYNTRRNPQRFRRNRGFNSARELLRWWCRTSMRGFGQRFMCWLYVNESIGEAHCWDVDGRHYDFFDYVQIRENGKELPPP